MLTSVSVSHKAPEHVLKHLARLSPSKKNSGNSKKLAKLLGEDSEIPSRLPLQSRQPEETPFYLEPNYHPSEIIFDDKGAVKAGTLSALVERLTPHHSTGN